jgi:hypothetical protein
MPGRRPGDLLVSEDAAPVRSVVDPGHELGMTIVAEARSTPPPPARSADRRPARQGLAGPAELI